MIYLTQCSTDTVEDSTPSMTPRPVTYGSTDGSLVLVIVVPVSAAGTFLVNLQQHRRNHLIEHKDLLLYTCTLHALFHINCWLGHVPHK